MSKYLHLLYCLWANKLSPFIIGLSCSWPPEKIFLLLQKVKQLWHLAYLTSGWLSGSRVHTVSRAVVSLWAQVMFVCLFYALKYHYWQPDCIDRMSGTKIQFSFTMKSRSYCVTTSQELHLTLKANFLFSNYIIANHTLHKHACQYTILYTKEMVVYMHS